MSAAVRLPGIDGAMLEILQDPIAALCIGRQIDRDQGFGTTANLQEAAISLIVGDKRNEDFDEVVFQKKAG